MLVGRLTRADATASWRLDRPAVRRGAAAFVNLADLVTVVEQGGTWRTQATYRVKNLSRQFLAVEIPDGSEILSVTVQHKPARAVRTTVKGKSFNLIPLPEVSEGDLSFDVQMVVGGRLAGGSLPEGPRLFGDKVSLVTPQVVTWESDADYGIPVARTRWTVWFPKDEQVRVLTSSQRHQSRSGGRILGQCLRATRPSLTRRGSSFRSLKPARARQARNSLGQPP